MAVDLDAVTAAAKKQVSERYKEVLLEVMSIVEAEAPEQYLVIRERVVQLMRARRA